MSTDIFLQDYSVCIMVFLIKITHFLIFEQSPYGVKQIGVSVYIFPPLLASKLNCTLFIIL